MYSDGAYAKLTNEEKLKIANLYNKGKKLEELSTKPFDCTWRRVAEYVDVVSYLRNLTGDIPEFAFLDAISEEGDVCSIYAYEFAYNSEDKNIDRNFSIKFSSTNGTVDMYKAGELYDDPCLVITPINGNIMPLVIEFHDEKIMELLYHELMASYTEITIKNKYTIKAVYFDDGKRVNILDHYYSYSVKTYSFTDFAFETHTYKTNANEEDKYINRFYGKAEGFIKALDEACDPKDMTAIYCEDINKYFECHIKMNICNDERLKELRTILASIANTSDNKNEEISMSIGDSILAEFLDVTRIYFYIEYIPKVNEIYPVIDKLLDEKIKALEEN